jgi:hypothetical protein
MRNRPIVKRLRPYTSTRTWAQLNSLTKAGVIAAFAAAAEANPDKYTAFSDDELKQLNRWGVQAFRFLKREWIRSREDTFIQNRYLPAFRSAINPSLSSYTVNQVYEYTLSEGLSIEDAQAIYKKAVGVYHGEVL